MRLEMSVALVVALTVAADAGDARRFDLICTGRTTITKPGIDPIVKPAQGRMSVDLAANRWCWRSSGGGCLQTFPIVARHGSRLVLRDGRGADGSSRVEVDLATRRYVSNIHISTAQVPDLEADEAGRCSAAPYTQIR